MNGKLPDEPRDLDERTLGELDALASRKREAEIGSALEASDPELEARARDHLRGLMDTSAERDQAPETAGSRARSFVSFAVPLAAAALLVFWVARRGGGDTDGTLGTTDRTLDPADVTLGPTDAVPAFTSHVETYRVGDRITWKLLEPPRGHLLLEVEDALSGELIHEESLDNQALGWTPPGELAWPENIRIRLVPVELDGRWGKPAEVELRRGGAAIQSDRDTSLRSLQGEPQADLWQRLNTLRAELAPDPSKLTSKRREAIETELTSALVEVTEDLRRQSPHTWAELCLLLETVSPGYRRRFGQLRELYGDEVLCRVVASCHEYVRSTRGDGELLEFYSAALSMELKTMPDTMANLAAKAAQSARSTGRHRAAESLLEGLGTPNAKAPSTRLLVLQEEVQLCIALGRDEQSVAALERMERLVEAELKGDLPANLRAACCRGDVLLSTLRFDEAQRHVESALTNLPEDRTADTDWFVAQLLAQQATASWERLRNSPEKDHSAAAEALSRSLGFEALDSRTAEYLHRRLFDVWLDAGNYERAEAALTQFEANQATRYGNMVALASRGRLALERYRFALREGVDPPDLESSEEALRAGVTELLETWDAAPLGSDGIGLLNDFGTRQVVATYIDLLLTRSHETDTGGMSAGVRAALATLHSVGLRGSLLRARRSTPSLEETLATLCTSDRGVLYLFPGLERAHVFAIDSGGATHGSIDLSRADSGRKQVLRGLQRVRGDAQASTRLTTATIELGEAMLPANVVQRLDTWASVTIVGSEFFVDVPFEILRPFRVDPEDPSPRLGDRLALAYLPSLPLGALLTGQLDGQPDESEQAKLVPASLLVVATLPPALTLGRKKLVELPLGVGELRDLGGKTPGTRLLKAEDARLSMLRSELEDGDFTRAHLVCHGVPVLEDPRGFALGLADGPLTYPQIAALAWPAVVVVSACGAGRAVRRIGEDGCASLAGAFFEGGSTVVLSSTSDLNYSDVLRWTRELEEHRRASHSIAESLRLIRLGLSDAEVVDLWRAVGLPHDARL